MGQHMRFGYFSHMQKSFLNAQTDLSTRTRGQKFWYESSFTTILVYASREVVGESGHCAGLPESSLLNNVRTTEISCSGLNVSVRRFF